MIYFLKHCKGIAYFLIMLILFQSCVAYNKNTSTIEDATSEKDTPIRIITKNGNQYKLWWIEEIDGNIVSMKNVDRDFINKNEIVDFVIFKPEPKVVSLDLALKNQGPVRILTRGENDKYNTHEYLRIRANDEIITGYKMTKKDTLTVSIPIDQIHQIHLKDKKRSTIRTTVLLVGVGLGVYTFVAVIVGLTRFITGDWD